jgi:hypothetical protein
MSHKVLACITATIHYFNKLWSKYQLRPFPNQNTFLYLNMPIGPCLSLLGLFPEAGHLGGPAP